jgi:hypothetical protein
LGVGGEQQKGGGRDGDGRVELDAAMATTMLEDMTYLIPDCWNSCHCVENRSGKWEGAVWSPDGEVASLWSASWFVSATAGEPDRSNSISN